MIHVIARISTVPGRRDDALKLFAALIPEVRAEAGCIEYGTAVDLDAVVDNQPAARSNVLTVVEKWEDPAALKAHLVAPHMIRFRESAKDIITGVEIRVLTPA